MNKKLVCYFSATGATKLVSQKISQILKCDLFEIEPVEKYSREDLDWTNKNSRSSIEMADENSRPSLKNKVDNIEDYNIIYIGFPVWWYREPSIIDTFIETNNLSEKIVHIFVTSGDSSVNGSLESLRKRYSTINFVDGKRLSSNISESDILDWI